MKRLFALLVTICIASAEARGPDWRELHTERFIVVSQLSDRDTRRWAAELDQFINALQQLYSVDGLKLPPLTMVLFDEHSEFVPYSPQTVESLGFFTNTESWSVIGLAGRKTNFETRRLIYHEAVHWFTSGFNVEAPLWFTEGLAELFSTFDTKGDEGIWGVPLPENVFALSGSGIRSIELLLRASRFAGQHRASWFYPQSWLFLHYAMYGNNGSRRAQLQQFLRQTQVTDVETAFTTSFGMSFSQMEQELADYLVEGRYVTTSTPVRDRSDEMIVRVADQATVELALGRLAVVTEHLDLARRHAVARTEATPESPPGFELLALVEELAENPAAQHAALDEAMRLGSSDARVYSSKGWGLLRDSVGESRSLDAALDPGTARTAANLFIRSIALRSRNAYAYDGLGLALLSVDAVTDQDAIVLSVGRLALPTRGSIPIGQAAVERLRGNNSRALSLLRESLQDPFTLPAEWYQPIGALHASWSATPVSGAELR